MTFLSKLDLAEGDLPPWINQAVAVARPLFTASAVAIPSIGSFVIGAMAAWWPDRAMAMSKASTSFLQGIPDAAWGAITAIALGYTAGKTVEVVKAPKPAGGSSPEQPVTTTLDAARAPGAQPAGLDPENLPPPM